MATRQSNLALSKHVQDAVDILKASGFDLIILETSGIGQSDTEITEHSDVCLYVMTPEYGAATQLKKLTCWILQILLRSTNLTNEVVWMLS
jgi:methylmalonyl-CoA mutase